MPDWLYDTGNGWVFLLVTVIIGGSAAFLSGRAIAQTWRPYWHIPLYMVPIAASVRFFHYALFHEPMLSLQNYIVDFAVVLAAASLGYRCFAHPPDGAAVSLAVPPYRTAALAQDCLEIFPCDRRMRQLASPSSIAPAPFAWRNAFDLLDRLVLG